MNQTRLKCPRGTFILHRLPRRRRETLRAWDAADEYLLNTLGPVSDTQQNVLIVNDAFGALSVALSDCKVQNWSDSWLAHEACRQNLAHNGLPPGSVEYVDSLQTPQAPLDIVLIKIPKTLALLEYQLLQLRPLLSADSRILLAGMTRAMPSSLWKMLEAIIGPTQTRPAIKKAKLIELRLDDSLSPPPNRFPVCWPLPDSGLEICNHANVFSRDRLDIGARFMLQHLPPTEGAGEIIDLGCGNGVLGLMAAAQNPQAIVHFADESYMALASARANCAQWEQAEQRCRFHIGDGLTGFADASADLILCNPPFHQQQAIGDAVALAMFRHSARVLRAGGELIVIGNRHLGYHKKLKSYFNHVEVIASNPKFVILHGRLG